MVVQHKRILAVHAVLAFVGLTLAGLDGLSQPYRMICIALSLVIPAAQFIFLAAWSVLGSKVAWRRILLSAFVVALMSLLYVRAVLNWYVVRQSLRSEPYLPWLQSNMLKQLALSEAFLASMMLVGLCARKWLGRISQTADEHQLGQQRNTRMQFSLTTALVVLSIGAVFLGLVRGANQAGNVNGPQEVFRHLLTMAVFALLMLTAVWATLSSGAVSVKVLIAFAVSLVLGEALSDNVALPAGRAYFPRSAARYFVTLLTTGLLVCTFLYARKLGYRLGRSTAVGEPDLAEQSAMERQTFST